MLPDPPAPASNFSKAEFLAAVARCKDYIAAGDAFQIVISQRFSVAVRAAAVLAVSRAAADQSGAVPVLPRFRRVSPWWGRRPEVLVRLRDGMVTIRPLAGTRRRGATYEEDQALEAELLADPKERAEHLMLLDLGRNDVGRVAEIGSVKVTESFVIERFSHVMHISSNVEGRLRDGLDALDALVGGFPGGHAVRRAEGAGDGDHRGAGTGRGATSTPAASAISPRTARWTPASGCAPRW